MEIYIEYVIIDNLIINYLILSFTDYVLKLKCKKSLKWLSSIVGTIVAVCLPLITINTGIVVLDKILMLAIKISLGIVMTLIIKKYNNFKEFITSFMLFLTTTFIFGGLCFGLIYLLGFNTTFSGVIINGYEIPISLIILLIFMYFKIISKLVKVLRHKNTYSDYYYEVKFVDNKTTITGFLDSGNQLNEDDGGIIVINFKTLLKLYPNINIKNIIVGDLKNSGLKNAHFINLVNSSGKSKMLTFTMEKIEIIDSKENVITLCNQQVGLAKASFAGKFDCLLSPSLIGQRR